jgi:hypothetical protein
MSVAQVDSGAGLIRYVVLGDISSIYVDKIEKYRHVRIDVSAVST